jgi:hypothetical protein
MDSGKVSFPGQEKFFAVHAPFNGAFCPNSSLIIMVTLVDSGMRLLIREGKTIW